MDACISNKVYWCVWFKIYIHSIMVYSFENSLFELNLCFFKICSHGLSSYIFIYIYFIHFKIILEFYCVTKSQFIYQFLYNGPLGGFHSWIIHSLPQGVLHISYASLVRISPSCIARSRYRGHGIYTTSSSLCHNKLVSKEDIPIHIPTSNLNLLNFIEKNRILYS